MRNCKLYTGKVRHRRFYKKSHEFTYKLFMFFLDLDNIKHQFSQNKFISFEKFNWFYFRRKNYLEDKNLDLAANVRELIYKKTKIYPEGKIFLLTNLSCLGYCINPISLYFILDDSDLKISFLIVEVTNTPWGEKFMYILKEYNSPKAHIYKYEFSKQLHVSPFLSMSYQYFINLKFTKGQIILHIENRRNSIKHFDATLTLNISEQKPTRVFLRHPFMTYKVAAAIYWQALQLFVKRIPFYSHPAKE